MHPIIVELFTRPVGWMTLGGIAFMILMAVYLWAFARRRIREEERAGLDRAEIVHAQADHAQADRPG